MEECDAMETCKHRTPHIHFAQSFLWRMDGWNGRIGKNVLALGNNVSTYPTHPFHPPKTGWQKHFIQHGRKGILRADYLEFECAIRITKEGGWHKAQSTTKQTISHEMNYSRIAFCDSGETSVATLSSATFLLTCLVRAQHKNSLLWSQLGGKRRDLESHYLLLSISALYLFCAKSVIESRGMKVHWCFG